MQRSNNGDQCKKIESHACTYAKKNASTIISPSVISVWQQTQMQGLRKSVCVITGPSDPQRKDTQTDAEAVQPEEEDDNVNSTREKSSVKGKKGSNGGKDKKLEMQNVW